MIVYKVVSKDRRSIIAKHPAFVRVYRKGVMMKPRKGRGPLLAFENSYFASEFLGFTTKGRQAVIIKCEAVAPTSHSHMHKIDPVWLNIPTKYLRVNTYGWRTTGYLYLQKEDHSAWPTGTVFCTELTPLE